jgi:branched-chain amino acid transport system substrate-binding protein
MGKSLITSRRALMKNSVAAAAVMSLDWASARAQGEAVRIGVIYDLTGPFAAGGSVACSVGTQIAIDLVNERGGIGGKYKIAAVNADSQSRPDIAINEAERLISQEKLDIINGIFASSHAVPLSAKVGQQKKILWITTAVATAVFKDKNLHYVFRAQIHSDQYGQAFASFITEHAQAKLGMDPKDVKVALIHEDGPYGVGVAAADEAYAKQAGLPVALKEGYSASAPDLSVLVTKIKRSRADVISHAGYNPDITLFLRQARESGLRFKMLFGAGAGYSQLDKLARRLVRTSTISATSTPCRRNCSIPPSSRRGSAISPRPWSSATRRKPARPTCRRTARWALTRPGCCSTTCCLLPRRNMAASIPRPWARRRSMSTFRRAARSRATA